MSEQQQELLPHLSQILNLGAQSAQRRVQSIKETRNPCPPPGLSCPGVTTEPRDFENWSEQIQIPGVPTARVNKPEDAVCIANWAKDNRYTIRPVGCSHNWSPLVLPDGSDPCGKVLLADTSRLTSMRFNAGPNPSATFGTGVTIEAATAFLEKQDNGGSGAAPGYSFLNFTAPGKLTLGGVLAIGGHGTGVPWAANEPNVDGCLSNLILSFKAVVTDPAGNPNTYTIKEFKRSALGAPAFLVHLGRAFLVEVTLAVVPNYYLQVRNWYPDKTILFQPGTAPRNPESLSSLLETYGRLEVIWFVYTSQPWVKTWQRMGSAIEPQVKGPYNYPWANSIPKPISDVICAALRSFPAGALLLGPGELATTQAFAPAEAVMNGTARDLLLYVQDDTLRVTAFGYAVQLQRHEVQDAVHAFYTQFNSLLLKYNARLSFPANVAMEIRVTTVDDVKQLGVPAFPPALSACNPANPNVDTVLWLDVLTAPGTPGANEFFEELEKWMNGKWGETGGNVLRPEWSKGWAYTSSGAWTNQQIITNTIPSYFGQSFKTAQQTLAKYDKFNIYTNAFLKQLLPGN